MIVRALVLLLSTCALQGFLMAEDCTDTVGAALVDGTCECQEADHVISSDRGSCVRIVFGGYDAPCNDSAQCVARMSSGAGCVDGSCACVDNFHYLHGRCWRNRGYGERCSSDSSCYAYSDWDSMVCSDGKCICGANTYQPHKTMCRRRSAEGEPCDFDLDCGEGLWCSNKTYTCDPTTEAIPEKYDAVQVSVDDDSEDELKTCADCEGLNKECTPGGQCVCAMGFFDTTGNGTCLPELGEPCTSDDDCAHVEYGACRRSGSTGGRVCGCQGSWVPHINNKACVKTRKYTFNCQEDVQCSYYGGFCFNKKTCMCPEGSHFTNDVCWPAVGLGDKCSDPRDCSVPNGEGVNCIDNVCKCSEGYFKTSTNDCWKIPEVLGDPCEDISQCDFAPNATCDDKECSCIEGFQPGSDMTCLVGVGGPCEDDIDCAAVPTYNCVNNICACPEGTIVGIFTGECLKEATEYGDNCTEVTQCSHLLGEHATCDEEGTCRCSQDYHYRGRQCWPTKRLGEVCSKASECYADQDAERMECRSSVCACKYEFQEDTVSRTCTSSGTRLSLSLAAATVCYLLLHTSG